MNNQIIQEYKLVLIIISLLFIVLIAGCAYSGFSGTYKSMDRFESNNQSQFFTYPDAIITFRPDGTYRETTDTYMEGTYKINQDKISICYNFFNEKMECWDEFTIINNNELIDRFGVTWKRVS